MDLRDAYDMIMKLEQLIQADLMHEAEIQLGFKPHQRGGPDYRTVKALAATYELQDYLANQIALAGDLDPDE